MSEKMNYGGFNYCRLTRAEIQWRALEPSPLYWCIVFLMSSKTYNVKL